MRGRSSDRDVGSDEDQVTDNEVDEDELAGDFVVDFGKAYLGKLLCQCGKDWIAFCLSQSWSRYKQGFRQAATRYMRYLDEHPGKCVIPFGKKPRNALMQDCRDIPWIEWCIKQPGLLKRYPLWCEAAELWLNNRPIRYYGVIRDIGERTDIDAWRKDLEEDGPDEYERDGFVTDDPDSGEEEGEEEAEEDGDESMTAQSTEDGERSTQESLEDEDQPMESPSEDDEPDSEPAPRVRRRTQTTRRTGPTSSGEDSEVVHGSDSVSSQAVSEEGVPHRPHTRSQAAALKRRAQSPGDDVAEPSDRSPAPRTPARQGLPTPKTTVRRLPRTPPRIRDNTDAEDSTLSTPQPPSRRLQRRPAFSVPDSEGEDDRKRLLRFSSPMTPPRRPSQLNEELRPSRPSSESRNHRIAPSPRTTMSSQAPLTPGPSEDDMEEDDTLVRRPGRGQSRDVRMRRILSDPSVKDEPAEHGPSSQRPATRDSSGDDNDDEPLSVRKTARKQRAAERELRRLFDSPAGGAAVPGPPATSHERPKRSLKRLFSSMSIKVESDADGDDEEEEDGLEDDVIADSSPRKRRRTSGTFSVPKDVRKFVFY